MPPLQGLLGCCCGTGAPRHGPLASHLPHLQEVTQQLMSEFNCHPVFLGTELKNNYYKREQGAVGVCVVQGVGARCGSQVPAYGGRPGLDGQLCGDARRPATPALL